MILRTYETGCLGLRTSMLLLDCADGATCRFAPSISDFGTAVETINADPDRKNINTNCDQHPRSAFRKVVAAGLGLAFDGDGGWLITVDETRDVLGVIVFSPYAPRRLPGGWPGPRHHGAHGDRDIGFGEALKALGIRHVQAAVGPICHPGDPGRRGRARRRRSGRMIFAAHQDDGDGVLSAVKLVEAIVTASAPLSHLKEVGPVFPRS